MLDYPHRQHPAEMDLASRQALPSWDLIDYSRIVDILGRSLACELG